MAGINVGSTTIASGQTKSSSINVGNGTIAKINIPAAFTGTAMTFEGSFDDTTFVPIQDGAGAAISKTVSASIGVKLDAADLWGYPYIKFVSGSAEGAERTITFSFVSL
jgi:hypothetical protein